MGIKLSDEYISQQLYPIWPENVEAARFFFSCSKCWSVLVGPTGQMHYQGLDPTKVGAMRIELEMAPSRERMEKLQEIERGALAAMNKQS